MIASAGRTGKQQEQQQKPELHPSQKKKHRICRKSMEISCIFSLLCKEITFIVAEIQSLSSFFYGENSRNIAYLPIPSMQKFVQLRISQCVKIKKNELKESLFCLRNGARFGNCQLLNGANSGKSKQKTKWRKIALTNETF